MPFRSTRGFSILAFFLCLRSQSRLINHSLSASSSKNNNNKRTVLNVK
jgi:hypothetical protein